MEKPVLEKRETDEEHDGAGEQGAAMNIDNGLNRQATVAPSTSLSAEIPDVGNFPSL